MSLSPIVLHAGAVLVADAHYASYRPLFKQLLDDIERGKIVTTQLVLLGDIFDLLFGPVDAFVRLEHAVIDQINRIATHCEVIYLEGNHDFLLASLFPGVRVIERKLQPYPALMYGEAGWLAHGDWDGGWSYGLYTKIIRNRLVVMILNRVDRWTRGAISTRLRTKMQTKRLCRSYEGFALKIKNRFERYTKFTGWFIEGHFHQGNAFETAQVRYFNLESLACNKSYFVVQSKQNGVLLAKHTLEESVL